jgi:SulP family sulfate permease
MIQPKEMVTDFQPPRKNLVADLIAGLTFAVVNIPSSMAHAMMATVNPVLGTYTLIFGMPIAAIFTSSVFMNVSTTSALSVAVGSTLTGMTSAKKGEALIVLVILVGIIQILLGLFRQGSLTRFVPNSVMVGFANGVAVLIILGQLSDFTGYKSAYANKVAQTLDMVLNVDEISYQSFAIGLITLLLVLILSRTRLRKISAILALTVATALVQIVQWSSIPLIQNVATFPTRLPRPTLPDFSLITSLIIPALSITIVGLVQGAIVSQSIPNPNGKYPDVSRDFFGQGIANFVTGFFQGIPAGGSMSGTSLSINSGARTRWANIFAGVFVAIIILAFEQFVGLVPMPALAALVLLAGFNSLQIPAATIVYQTGLVPSVLMGLTFVLTLIIPLQYAVLSGVAISVLLYAINQSNQVKVVEIVLVPGGLPEERPAPPELPDNQATILYIFGSIFFAATKKIEKSLPSPENSNRPVVILGLRGHYEISSTFIKTLLGYANDLKTHGGKLMITGIDPQIKLILDRTGFTAAIGDENIFLKTSHFFEGMNEAIQAADLWLAA